MSKPFAKSFYKSAAWKRAREYVISRSYGMCERCRSMGRYTPGRIVHHKIPLTPENIGDPKVSLDPGNLEYLCHECHEIVHDELGVGAPNMRGPKDPAERKLDRPRVRFDADGNVVRK